MFEVLTLIVHSLESSIQNKIKLIKITMITDRHVLLMTGLLNKNIYFIISSNSIEISIKCAAMN